MISAKGAVDFRCSAFIDFVLQANAAERRWVQRLFGITRSRIMVVDKELECIAISGQGVCKISREGVRGQMASTALRIICRYPWILRSDDSASRLLTRDVLIHIYGQLHDPNDMWAFMRVNKLFHKAGCAYAGYAKKIERLKHSFQVQRLPFAHLSADSRRHFFALCFVSCKKDLEKQLIESALSNTDVFYYCCRVAYYSSSRDATWANLSSDGVLKIEGRLTLLGGRDSKFLHMISNIKLALIV